MLFLFCFCVTGTMEQQRYNVDRVIIGIDGGSVVVIAGIQQ